MKRRLLLLLMVLSLAFSCAQAEDAVPYTPGALTESLFADAFARGDMLTLDMQFDLSLSENAEAVFGEDAAMLVPLSEALKHAKFSLGAGMIDNGLRIALAGDYTVDSQTAALSAALDLTADGFVLSSSAIPGESLSGKWETLLTLAGASEEDIATIASLIDTDFEALIAELITQLQPIVDMAMQIAAPYGETIMAHLAALPMQINENVPAEYGFPAAAAEIQIQISDKYIGDLIVALAQQLKADTTLCSIIDAMLAEQATEENPAMTTAQLCDAVIEAAQTTLTDETQPLHLFAGMDEAGMPEYFGLSHTGEDGATFSLSFIITQDEETGVPVFQFDTFLQSAEGEVIGGLSAAFAYAADASDPNVMSAELILSGYAAGEEILTLRFYIDNLPAETASTYASTLAMAMNVIDAGSSVLLDMNANVLSGLTSDGGEEITVSGSLLTSVDGMEIPLTFEGGCTSGVVDGFPVATMTESAQLPDLGIALWRETYTLSAAPQTAPALTDTALETASPEALEALASRAVSSLSETVATLVELLPPEMMQLLNAPEETPVMLE